MDLKLVWLQYHRLFPKTIWFSMPVAVPMPSECPPEDYLEALRLEYPNTDWRFTSRSDNPDADPLTYEEEEAVS